MLKKLGWILLVIGIACAGWSILFFFPPGDSSLYPPCPFKTLTGYYCPGCGSARCLGALARGDIISALKKNLLVCVLLPYILYEFLRYFFAYLEIYELPDFFIKGIYIYALVVVIIIFWILRNIPCSPFCLLAPH